MLETVGTKLRRARSQRGLSLEDAARGTKIRVPRLADLEADRYTNFPNIAYAKSFLRSYGKFLGVDVRLSLDAFEDANSFGLDDYQYLSEKPVGVYRIQRRPQQRPLRARRRTLVLSAGVAALLAVAGLTWFLSISYQRLGPLPQLADHLDAKARGSKEPAAAGKRAAEPTPAPAGATSRPGENGERAADNTTNAVVAQVLTEHSPSQALAQFSAPAASVPVVAKPEEQASTGGISLRPAMQQALFISSPPVPASGEQTSAPAPAPAANGDAAKFSARALDRNSVEVFRTGTPPAPSAGGGTLQ